MLSSSRVSMGASSEDSDRHIVDISGPLLPHHIMNISAALQEKMATSSDSCVIYLNTHEHSIPFNMNLQEDPLTSENFSEIIAPSPEKQKKSPAAILPPKRRKILGSYDSSMRKECVSSDLPGMQSCSSSDITRSTPLRTNTLGANREHSERSKDEIGKSELFNDENFVAGTSPSSENVLQSGFATVKKTPLLRRSYSFGAFPPRVVKDTGLEGLPPVLIAAVSRGQGEVMSSRLKIWDNGLHQNVRGQLCVSSDLKEGTALREVHCLSQGYSWTS